MLSAELVMYMQVVTNVELSGLPEGTKGKIVPAQRCWPHSDKYFAVLFEGQVEKQTVVCFGFSLLRCFDIVNKNAEL